MIYLEEVLLYMDRSQLIQIIGSIKNISETKKESWLTIIPYLSPIQIDALANLIQEEQEQINLLSEQANKQISSFFSVIHNKVKNHRKSQEETDKANNEQYLNDLLNQIDKVEV